MGGRGSRSMSASSRVADVRAELEAIATSPGSSPRSREYARLAGVAAGMVGTDRARDLAGGVEVEMLDRYINVPSATRIEQVVEGVNNPGMDGNAYRNLGHLVRGLATRGYSYDEIAAATQFRNWFRRAG